MSLDIKWVGCHAANYAAGRMRGGRIYKPEAIVVHVMDGTLVGTDAFFNLGRPKAPSSAHYGIGQAFRKPGVFEVHQYVKDEDTAFHSGVIYNPTWAGFRQGINPNWNTIGIEHEGRADTVWPEEQYRLSALLIRQLCDRWKIPVDRAHIIGHRELYAVKPCPGKCDLDRLVKMAAAV